MRSVARGCGPGTDEHMYSTFNKEIKNMKKLIKAFKEGLEMYSNTLYGDINCRRKRYDIPQDFKNQCIKQSGKSKSLKRIK